jgi:hypothetical protein
VAQEISRLAFLQQSGGAHALAGILSASNRRQRIRILFGDKAHKPFVNRRRRVRPPRRQPCVALFDAFKRLVISARETEADSLAKRIEFPQRL